MRVDDSCHPASGDVERGGCWGDDTGKAYVRSPVGQGWWEQRLPHPTLLLFVILGQRVLHLILLEAGLSGVMP